MPGKDRTCCLVYDERMTRHRYNPIESEEEEATRASGWIPEIPDRITSIYKQLTDDGLVDRCLRLEARNATRQELLWLHDPKYLDKMESTVEMTQSALVPLENQVPTHFPDGTVLNGIYLCPESQESALLSAGSALQIVESILSGGSQRGVGIIRPPGHHTEGDQYSGFCIYNNTALAAKYALEVHGLERVLILDWDVHHGNGIQKMFEDDPRVLYISLHRWDDFPWNLDYSDCKSVGIGPGIGYNVNIPWPKGLIGDTEYLTAFNRIIMPIAYQFDPQLVLVAAGFDSARGDPLGCCDVTPEGYGQMTHLLTSLALGKVALFLEGGYSIESISKSMSMCVRALLDDPIPTPKVGTLHAGAAATILRVIESHRLYWKNLDLEQVISEAKEKSKVDEDHQSPDYFFIQRSGKH